MTIAAATKVARRLASGPYGYSQGARTSAYARNGKLGVAGLAALQVPVQMGRQIRHQKHRIRRILPQGQPHHRPVGAVHLPVEPQGQVHPLYFFSPP